MANVSIPTLAPYAVSGALILLVVAAAMFVRPGNTPGPEKPDPRVLRADETERLAEARHLVEEGQAILLDVRELDEWDAAHLANARHLATSVLHDPAARDKSIADLPKDQPIYCHCKMGGRALACTELLCGLGYDARALAMPYPKLVEAGFKPAEAGAR